MEKRSKRRYIVLIVAAILVLTLLPMSMTYAKKEKSEKVEKFIELADRAYNQANNLIEVVLANDTALGIIESAGLLEQLEGNETLLETVEASLGEAIAALVEGNDEVAIEKAKEAFSISREVFKAVNKILCKSGLEREDIIDGWGLLEALQRCLDRIEKIEGMIGITLEIQELLDEAKSLCDIEIAKELLAEGRVDEVVENKVLANKLISQAFVAAKKAAKGLNAGRAKNYGKIVSKFFDQVEHHLDIAERQGYDVTSLREQLEEVGDMLQNISEDANEAITQYIEIRNILEQIWDDLRDMRKGGPPEGGPPKEGPGWKLSKGKPSKGK